MPYFLSMRTLVTTRDTYYETGDPARLPVLLAGRWGTNELKQWPVRKKIFCTGPTRGAKAGQKSLVPARQAQRNNQGRTPFIFVLFESPYSQQGPTLSSLSGYHALSCSGVLRCNWTPPPSPRQQIGRSLQQPSSQLPSYTTVQVPR